MKMNIILFMWDAEQYSPFIPKYGYSHSNSRPFLFEGWWQKAIQISVIGSYEKYLMCR